VQTRSHPPAGTQSKSPSTHHQHRDVFKSFDEFLNHFFKQIYGIEQIRIEWAHTFYSMLVKETHCYKLIELKKIIDNKMDEECHWHFESWIKSIEEQILLFIDSNNNNNNSIELPSLSNLNMKGGSEPNQYQVSIQYMIDFNKLFEDIHAEDINPFISELLSVYKQLKTAFINDIVSEIQKLT
ncbi:unnamed protein product, partial [Trichobilharzia regenti]